MKNRWLIVACVGLGLVAAGMAAWTFWPRGTWPGRGAREQGAGQPLTQPSATLSQGARDKNSDSDHDGLPDWWEMKYFGNLAQGAGGDPDGDGLSNHWEYYAGEAFAPNRRDRLDASDHPRFSVTIPAGARVHTDTRPNVASVAKRADGTSAAPAATAVPVAPVAIQPSGEAAGNSGGES